ncbi:MAG: nucleoside triphosphate pyrophosphohydrolase [Bacilli bacterium]|nr:nucleoside triphosphate pyrophosphohydrolase [Bacilli bacterium]
MYHKLVRDKIPKIIEENGEIPVTRILSDENYLIELEKKLTEEHNEVLGASGDDRLEELADLLEVMVALAKIDNKTLEDIIDKRNEKRAKRGGFDNKIFLEDVRK